MTIIEDDLPESAEQPETSSEQVHPLLHHPLASELMDSVVSWITEEACGEPANEHLARVRAIAARMLKI